MAQVRNDKSMKQDSVTVWIRRVRKEGKHKTPSKVSGLSNRVVTEPIMEKGNAQEEEEEEGVGEDGRVLGHGYLKKESLSRVMQVVPEEENTFPRHVEA